MVSFIRGFFLFSIGVALHQSFATCCTIYQFDVEKNKAFENHVIKTMTTNIKQLCRDACVQLNQCFSINVRPSEFAGQVECDLNNSSKTASPGSLVSKAGSEYHQMGEVSEPNRNLYYAIRKEEVNEVNTTAYWPLHEPNPNLTVGNNQYRTSLGRRAIYMVGGKSRVYVPAVPMSSSGFTIALWLKPNQGQLLTLTYVFSDKVSPCSFYLIYDRIRRTLSFGLCKSNGIEFLRIGMGITPDQWTHFVITWHTTGTKLRFAFYKNGQKIGYGTNNGAFNGSQTISKQYYHLGMRKDAPSRVFKSFRGYISDLVMDARMYSDVETRALYQMTKSEFSKGAWIAGLNLVNNALIWSDGNTVDGEASEMIKAYIKPTADGTCQLMEDKGIWISRKCTGYKPAFICKKYLP